MAVWISTPTFNHEDSIRVAANGKKAVFVEKPVAEHPEDISKSFAVCKAAGVPLCCGFQRRFDTGYVAMKNAVANGDIGKIIFINAMHFDHPCPSIEFLAKGGCPFMDLAPHELDFISWLLEGEEPSEVYASGSSSTQVLKEVKVCDNALLTAKYPSGATATVGMSRAAVYGVDNRMEVFGTKGRLFVESPAQTTLTKQDLMGTHTSRLPHSFAERFNQALGAEVSAFVGVSLQDAHASWPVGEAECVMVQRISMLAKLASQSGSAQKYEQKVWPA